MRRLVLLLLFLTIISALESGNLPANDEKRKNNASDRLSLVTKNFTESVQNENDAANSRHKRTLVLLVPENDESNDRDASTEESDLLNYKAKRSKSAALHKERLSIPSSSQSYTSGRNVNSKTLVQRDIMLSNSDSDENYSEEARPRVQLVNLKNFRTPSRSGSTRKALKRDSAEENSALIEALKESLRGNKEKEKVEGCEKKNYVCYCREENCQGKKPRKEFIGATQTPCVKQTSLLRKDRLSKKTPRITSNDEDRLDLLYEADGRAKSNVQQPDPNIVSNPLVPLSAAALPKSARENLNNFRILPVYQPAGYAIPISHADADFKIGAPPPPYNQMTDFIDATDDVDPRNSGKAATNPRPAGLRNPLNFEDCIRMYGRKFCVISGSFTPATFHAEDSEEASGSAEDRLGDVTFENSQDQPAELGNPYPDCSTNADTTYAATRSPVLDDFYASNVYTTRNFEKSGKPRTTSDDVAYYTERNIDLTTLYGSSDENKAAVTINSEKSNMVGKDNILNTSEDPLVGVTNGLTNTDISTLESSTIKLPTKLHTTMSDLYNTDDATETFSQSAENMQVGLTQSTSRIFQDQSTNRLRTDTDSAEIETLTAKTASSDRTTSEFQILDTPTEVAGIILGGNNDVTENTGVPDTSESRPTMSVMVKEPAVFTAVAEGTRKQVVGKSKVHATQRKEFQPNIVGAAESDGQHANESVQTVALRPDEEIETDTTVRQSHWASQGDNSGEDSTNTEHTEPTVFTATTPYELRTDATNAGEGYSTASILSTAYENKNDEKTEETSTLTYTANSIESSLIGATSATEEIRKNSSEFYSDLLTIDSDAGRLATSLDSTEENDSDESSTEETLWSDAVDRQFEITEAYSTEENGNILEVTLPRSDEDGQTENIDQDRRTMENPVTKIISQNDSLPFCDNTLLLNVIKMVLNNFTLDNNINFNQRVTPHLGDTQTEAESLVPEILDIPKLKELLLEPRIENMLLKRIKSFLTQITGIQENVLDGDRAKSIIQKTLRNFGLTIPGMREESKLPPMTVEEHEFKAGKWTTNLVTLLPQTVGETRKPSLQENIRSLLGQLLDHPTVGASKDVKPALKNIIVAAIQNAVEEEEENYTESNKVDGGVIQNILENMLHDGQIQDDPKSSIEESTETFFKVTNFEEGESTTDDNQELFRSNINPRQKATSFTGIPKVLTTYKDPISSEESEEQTTDGLIKDYPLAIEHPELLDHTNSDYALLGESDERTDSFEISKSATTAYRTESTPRATNEYEYKSEDDSLQDLPTKYYSPKDRILSYIKNHQQAAKSTISEQIDDNAENVTEIIGGTSTMFVDDSNESNEMVDLANTEKNVATSVEPSKIRIIEAAEYSNDDALSTVNWSSTEIPNPSPIAVFSNRNCTFESTTPEMDTFVGGPIMANHAQSHLDPSDECNDTQVHGNTSAEEESEEVNPTVSTVKTIKTHEVIETRKVVTKTTVYHSSKNALTENPVVSQRQSSYCRNKLKEDANIGSALEENPLYLGRIVGNDTIESTQDLSNLLKSNLYYVGDGVKLPLEIKKLSDGSYGLSISEKICQRIMKRRCPCCVPLEGNVVRLLEGEADSEDGGQKLATRANGQDGQEKSRRGGKDARRLSDQRMKRSLVPNLEELESTAMPVVDFAKRYNLTLNVDDSSTIARMDTLSLGDDTNSSNNMDEEIKKDSCQKSNRQTRKSNFRNELKKKRRAMYRYQRNVDENSRKRTNALKSILFWLKDLFLPDDQRIK